GAAAGGPPPGHVEDCWDEPVAPAGGDRPDLEALQGVWVSVAGRRAGLLLVSGSHFTVRFTDGDIYIGAFPLDAEARPKAVGMAMEGGPGDEKGKTALCIYHLDGDTLRWCVAAPGQKERLRAFPSGDGPDYLSLVFRREHAEGALRGAAGKG